MSALNFQFEEVKDKEYAIPILNKVFSYYKKNFDNIILNLPDFACFFFNPYCTNWFAFNGNAYSFTIVNILDESKWQRIYVYKTEGDKVYRISF